MPKREAHRPSPDSFRDMGDMLDQVGPETGRVSATDQTMEPGVEYRPGLVDRIFPPASKRRKSAATVAAIGATVGVSGVLSKAAYEIGGQIGKETPHAAAGVEHAARTVTGAAETAGATAEDARRSVADFFSGEDTPPIPVQERRDGIAKNSAEHSLQEAYRSRQD